MKIKDLNHSFSLIEVEDLNFQLKLMNLLSVYAPGYQYSPQYKSGQWDGKIHFYKVTPHGLVIPKGLVDVVIAKYGYALEEPYKPIFIPEQVTQEELDEFIKTLNLPFEPRDYQKKAVLTMLNKARGVIISATGSGKSLMIYLFLMYMYKQGKKSVLIVPNVSLVEQMKSDFISYGFKHLDDLHIIYAGKEKHFKKPLTITTWQAVAEIKGRTRKWKVFDEKEFDIGDNYQERGIILNKKKRKLKKIIYDDGSVEFLPL